MVGIVILNFNNSAQTLACLKTIREHVPSEAVAICVVDNASRVEEYAKLLDGLSSDGSVAVLRNEHNGGYARGNDLGCEYFAKQPQVDKILILNDDTRFTMDIITPMAEYLDTHAQCGVVFPLVLAPDGSVDGACARLQKTGRDLFLQATSAPVRRLLAFIGIQRREFLPTDRFTGGVEVPEAVQTEVPPGSCMMLPKELFQRIGWLDPNTFLYFEEHIISAKMKKEGRSCVLLPRINIVHLGAQTTKKQPSKAVFKHWRHSYLYFMKQYSNLPWPLQQYLRFRTWLKTLL